LETYTPDNALALFPVPFPTNTNPELAVLGVIVVNPEPLDPELPEEPEDPEEPLDPDVP